MKWILLSSLLFTTLSLHASENAALRKAAVDKFLAEANNPKTALAKIIDQINSDNTDGRNNDGTIVIPVVRKSLQVATLFAENLTNPWHYAEKSEDGKTCLAGGDSATFLILLESRMGVHMASDFDPIPFSVDVAENFKATRKDGGVIEYCEDVAYDETDSYIVDPVEYTVSDFREVEIKTKE